MNTFFSLSSKFQTGFSETHSDSGFTIRVAQQEDLVDLVDIIASSFPPRRRSTRWLFPLIRMGIYEDLRQRLRSPLASNYVCLVAVTSSANQPSHLLGTVEVALQATYPFQIGTSHYPYLSNLAVHRSYRRQGVAQRLLGACEYWVANQGFCDIHLHVLEDNHAAKQLYSKCGYQLQTADPAWCRLFLKRPRRLLLHKHFSKSL